MRKLIPAIGLCAFLFSLTTANAQEKWSLRECVEYALANNISVRQEDITAKMDELTLHQSRLDRYPSAILGANGSINTGRFIDPTTNLFTTQSVFTAGFSFQSSVDLFNFFSKKNDIAGNKYNAEASRANVDKIKNDIALNVAAAYLQALLSIEQANISEVQVKQTSAQLNNTRKLVDAGTLPELNAAEIEAQLARDSSTLITARGAATQNLLLLKALLNLDAGKPFDIETPPVENIPVEPLATLQPADVYALALINMPQQRVNSLRISAAQKYAEAAKGRMYPSLSLGANLRTNYSGLESNSRLESTTMLPPTQPIGVIKGTTDTVLAFNQQRTFSFFSDPFGLQFSDNFGTGIGLNLSVPLFNGGVARTNYKRALLTVKTWELTQEQSNYTLKQDIYTAYTNAVTALQKFNASQKSVETAEKAYNFANRRYEIGLLNSIDLITNQSLLFRARLERSAAQYEYVFRTKVLEFYRGQGIKL
ncbi:MAG TPA: TolC family protein [Chitinophagaceae bacterium]